MLIEMKCNEFKNGVGELRPAIKFHAGLNVVVGSFGASSSVGKSTFLMAIDFVFGGDDYISKLRDVVHTHIPAQEFRFAFEFDGECYYFIRTTIDSAQVFPCNSQYAPDMGMSWSIRDYRDWLYTQYCLPTDNPETRSHISRFFRVYHRGNVSEKRPLLFTDGGNVEAIDCLLQLMGEQSLKYAKDEYNKSNDKLKVYKKATAYNFIPGAVDEDDLRYNVDEIARLQGLLQDLIAREPAQLEALNVINDNERSIAALKNRLAFVRQQRGQLETQIAIVMRNAEAQNTEHFTDRFDDLMEFFPTANKALFEKVEGFHIKLSGFLAREFTAVRDKLNIGITDVNVEIASIEAEITELGKRDKAAESFAEEYYGIKAEIERLERQNASFKTLIDLQNDMKAQKESLRLLEEMKQAKLKDVSERITKKMWDINEEICGDKLSAPDLVITSLGKYNFRTFNDGGTSASYRGLVIFDLAILALTALPALAHDFVVLNNIDVAQRERVFSYYAAQTAKQIFIALDDEATYSEPTKKLLDAVTVLRLSTTNGDVLFGRTWNTKAEQEHVQRDIFEFLADAQNGKTDNDELNDKDDSSADEFDGNGEDEN